MIMLKGEKIGSLTNAVSNDRSIMINRINDVKIVSTRDRNTGEVTTDSSAIRYMASKGLLSAAFFGRLRIAIALSIVVEMAGRTNQLALPF